MSRFWTLGHVLRRCHQANIAAWSAAVGPVPTAPQSAVLSVLDALPGPDGVTGPGTGGADMQFVGTVASLEKTTLTGVARRLERDGWIQRREDPRDRRRQLLALTSAGRVALRQTMPLAARAGADFLAPVPAADHERLTRHLRDLGRVSPAPPPGTGLAEAIWQRLTATPGHLIRRAQQAHTAHWLAEFGQELTGPQYAVLRMTGLAGEITHARLAELAALDKATLSGVVDRLSRRGLLTAQPDPRDKRARLLALTGTGRELERSARPRVRRVQVQTAEPVADADWPWLQDALEKLAFRSGTPEIDLDTLAVDEP